MPDIRVRFAPSPTGDPHIGSTWTALFNYVFAKQQHGTFVLRIEDTDQKRLVAGSTDRIFDVLDWLGMTPDEGPKQGGPYGPYVQSERVAIHKQHALRLVEQGHAYYCFCTAERLEELRAQQSAAKLAPRYDKRCAMIPREEAAARVAAGEQAVIRMNLPATGTVTLTDVIRGTVTFAYDQLDDSVILKSDGFPTYHLANVVDDHLMQISHVIRAEEWLPSAPKHLFLYEAFGWKPPVFAHLPQLLGTDRSKLSKRHGSTAALSFRDTGYLAGAMRNFLVLMGWHPKGDEEVLSFSTVIADFRLEDVNPSGAIFDRTKLDWMNGRYIREMSPPALVAALDPFWHVPAGESPDAAWKERAVVLVRERMKTLSEIDTLINFTFASVWNAEVVAFDRAQLVPKKGHAPAVNTDLAWAHAWFTSYAGDWDAGALKAAMLEAIAAAGKKNGDVLWPARVALTLRPASPDVFDVAALLGRDETLRRLSKVSA